MCFSIQWTLGKHFLPPAGYGSIFPAKSCWDAWRSGSQLARGWVNMADEAKFHSPIYSMFEQLIVWCVVGHCRGEKLGPFYWPMPAPGIAVFGVFHWFAEHYFSDVMVCWNSESCSESDQKQTTKQWPSSFLGASLALGSVLELLLGPTTEVVITSCHIKSTFHHMSQPNGDMVYYCCIE